MIDVMLDIETMSTDSHAAIVSIGAVEFDLDTQTLGREFYTVIDLKTAPASRSIDADTIAWWMRQSDAARLALFDPDVLRAHYLDALSDFHNWLMTGSLSRIWGNGSNFDNVIVANAFKAAEMPVPWDYWLDRDYRTAKHQLQDMLRWSGIEVPPEMQPELAHHAISDAIAQAQYLMQLHAMVRRLLPVQPAQPSMDAPAA